MADLNRMDQIFHFIMTTFVSRGNAPHYTEIAKELNVAPEEGKKLLHELIGTGVMPMWLAPDTDVIASFAPFNNLPTQYHVTVDGQQKWFAQWGFESLAVCWVFTGKKVRVDAPCLDCGQPLSLVVKDGDIESQSHTEMCGYVDIPISKWAANWPHSWSRMNLFRSEEHVENWSGFKTGTDDAILAIADIMAILSTPRHQAKLNRQYVSTCADYVSEFFETIKKVTKNSEFWRPA